MAMGEVFIPSASFKMYENTVKSKDFIATIRFFKDVHWAGLESLLEHFCPPGLMFDILAIKQDTVYSAAAYQLVQGSSKEDHHFVLWLKTMLPGLVCLTDLLQRGGWIFHQILLVSFVPDKLLKQLRKIKFILKTAQPNINGLSCLA